MPTNEIYTPDYLIDPADLTCLEDALAWCGARIARDLIETNHELGAEARTDAGNESRIA
jgi:hypothetical protein